MEDRRQGQLQWGNLGFGLDGEASRTACKALSGQTMLPQATSKAQGVQGSLRAGPSSGADSALLKPRLAPEPGKVAREQPLASLTDLSLLDGDSAGQV